MVSSPYRQCLKCGRTRFRFSMATGPDGYRTLCNGCGKKYHSYVLNVYKHSSKNISVNPRPGCRPLRVIGFRMNNHGNRDLLRPLTENLDSNLPVASHPRPVLENRLNAGDTVTLGGRNKKPTTASAGRRAAVLKSWPEYGASDELVGNRGEEGQRVEKGCRDHPGIFEQQESPDSSTPLGKRSSLRDEFRARTSQSYRNGHPFSHRLAAYGIENRESVSGIAGNTKGRGRQRNIELLLDRLKQVQGKKGQVSRLSVECRPVDEESEVLSSHLCPSCSCPSPPKMKVPQCDRQMVPVKATLDARNVVVIRRFKIKVGLPYADFKRTVFQMFGARDNFLLRYKDDQGDFITVNSDEEVEELFEIVKRADIDPLIIHLS